MEWITVRVQAHIELADRTNPANSPSNDEIFRTLEQCASDAVDGTFGALPRRASLAAQSTKAQLSVGSIGDPVQGNRPVEFTLRLPAIMFPVGSGGLQHLVGVLASDAFPSRAGNCILRRVEVKEVTLPDAFQMEARKLFHSGGQTIDTIRSVFGLEKNEPLVAFSFKPRVGFDLQYANTITREVVGAGVRLVEFDTRNLQDPASALDEWATLADTASSSGKAHGKVATFAPNLSHASYIAVDLASQWCSRGDVQVPRVVKVDGGLDGLSTIQGIRRKHGTELIITSYPLLRSALSAYLGSPDKWIEMLTLSGVDIVYPGNRPTFSDEVRNVGGDESYGLRLSAARYDRFVRAKRPMPTFAAGAYPGQLQVAYELLGPDVAYFLGGAIALHPKGFRAGARLCVNILNEARSHAEDADHKGRPFGNTLSKSLLDEARTYQSTVGRSLAYTSPEIVFSGTGLLPFYRR